MTAVLKGQPPQPRYIPSSSSLQGTAALTWKMGNPSTSDEQTAFAPQVPPPEQSRHHQLTAREVRQSRVWSDLLNREALLTILFTSFGISFVSIMTVFLSHYLLRVPWIPADSTPSPWPTYGNVYMIPQMGTFIIGLGAEGAMAMLAIKAGLLFTVLYLLLDLFAFVTLLTWIAQLYTLVLNPVASNEFSTAAHFLLFVLTGALVYADIINVTRYIRVITHSKRIIEHQGRKAGLNDDDIALDYSSL